MIIDPPTPFDSPKVWHDFLEEIMAIIRDKGRDIRQSDLDAIAVLLAELPAEKRAEVEPWIYEGLALIVNDCLYEGDIPPIEWQSRPLRCAGMEAR
jgi:hypothetical protein